MPQKHKSIFVIALTIIFGFFVVTFSTHSQSQEQNSAENQHAAVPETSPTPDDTPHTLVGSFYTVQNGVNARLLLNNKGTTLLEVRPTIYNLAGQALEIAPVTVEPQSFRFVNLQDWAAIGGASFQSGSVRLFHRGKDLVLGAQIYLTDTAHSLSYEEKFAELGKFDSRRQEAVWFQPSRQTETAITLSNTSDAPLTVTGRLAKAPRHTSDINTFQLAAHETKVLDLRDDFSDGNQFANAETLGLSCEHTGAKDALLVRAAVADIGRGYSNVVQFSNPAGGKTSEYQGVGFHIDKIENQQLTPVVAARNVGTTTAIVTAKIPYTRTNGTRGTISLPPKSLNAGELALLDMRTAVQRAAQEQIKIAGLEITYNSAPGSVIVAAHSTAANGSLVLRVPMWDPFAQRSPTGGYPFRIEETSTTKTYIKNISDEEQDYVAFLILANGGEYMIGKKPIAAHETIEIDVRKLRDAQTPDEKGATIPLWISSGQLQWTLRRKDALPDDNFRANLSLIGRSEQIDTTSGMSSNYACQNCCSGTRSGGTIRPLISWEDGSELEFGDSRTYVAFEGQLTCYEYEYEFTVDDAELASPQAQSVVWSSSEAGVATVDSNGQVHTVGVGRTIILATWLSRVRYINYNCPPSSFAAQSDEKQCDEENKEIKKPDEEPPNTPELENCSTCFNRSVPTHAFIIVDAVPKVEMSSITVASKSARRRVRVEVLRSNTISGDNTSGLGVTNLTWNLR